LTPLSIDVDADGAATALKVSVQHNDGDGVWHETGHAVLPAHTILIAAGTQPNTVLAREDAAHFRLDGKHFRLLDEDGQPARFVRGLAKPAHPAVLTEILPDGRATSFFGDLHPSFSGNVVKAMASAKQGYPIVSRMLAKVAPASVASDADFYGVLDRSLRATIVRVERLTPTIVEVIVHAPAAAQRFQPGQFYRLQNYETLAMQREGHSPGDGRTGAHRRLGGPRAGAGVDDRAGDGRFIRPVRAAASRRTGRVDGTDRYADRDRAGETVVLVGGGLGNAVLFSIGQAFRAAGSKVLYFAGYKKMQDRYKVADIEAAADVVVWCSDEAPGFAAQRPQDRAFVGNIVQAMRAYASGELGEQAIRFSACDRIIAIGSDKMMAAVGAARHSVLAPYLKPDHRAIGSINSPMQCMLKRICAQCLQPQRDPVTGKVTYVFSCFNQDQPLDLVDFPDSTCALKQNALQEKVTARWIEHVTAGSR
jgi:NAD(P)H-flavin reductase